MRVEMQRLNRAQLLDAAPGEDSAVVKERVESARSIQRERYGPAVSNATASSDALSSSPLGRDAHSLLGSAIDAYDLSGRAVNRVLRVARTIADLECCSSVEADHMGEALTFRLRDVGEGVAA
jgi:magnesium chelatase family protein